MLSSLTVARRACALALFFISLSRAEMAPRPSAVIVVFRHGDRTPIDPYPNDPYGDPKYWPADWGQLTPKGEVQHYNLGKFFRERYGYLLDAKYNHKQIYVRSTDVDRSIMSALSNLAGLFPVNSSQEILDGLPWQPIPIHTIPQSLDDVLAMKTPCAKLTLEMEKMMRTKYFQDLNKQYQPVYRYVSNYTGRQINDMTTLSYIYDILKIEQMYNLTLPQWTQSVYPDKMEPISALSFVLDTFTPTLARLRVGPLIKEITSHLLNASKNATTTKMWVYSAHDLTLAKLLYSLNLKSMEMSPYAAHMAFELYKDDNDNHYVRVLYQDKELHIPKCGNSCPLYQWVTNYAHLIPDNHTEECKLRKALDIEPYNVLAYCMIGVISVLFMTNVITCYMIRKFNAVLNRK